MKDRIVMPLWSLGLFIVLLNTTMFNVSIPSIIKNLGISADLGSWVISSYSIGYALSTAIYSRLSDTVPVRRLLTVSLSIFGLASVLGIFANDFQMLLIARILQSVGSGAMAGLGLVLASRYIPYERRGRAIAMISAGTSMAFGLGPIVGGLVSEYFGWHGLFVVTCLVLALLPVLLILLPKEQPKPFQLDIIGATFTVVDAISLLTAVTQRSAIWFAVSVLSFATHGWHMRRVKEPFIRSELAGNPIYQKLFVVGFCNFALNLGSLFLMPLALSNLFGKGVLSIGLTLAPGAILAVFLSFFIGRWLERYGNIRLLLLSHCIMVVVMAVFSFELAASPTIILLGYLCFASAHAAAVSALNNETSRILPGKLIGAGMGLMQLIQFFGGSLSVAVCGLLLAYQKKVSPSASYQHIYFVLFLLSICALGVLTWYWKSSAKQDTVKSLTD